MRRPSHQSQQALLETEHKPYNTNRGQHAGAAGGVAAGAPSNRPRSAPAPSAQQLLRNERDGAYEAYERALEQGRAMLAAPYSASGQAPDMAHGSHGGGGSKLIGHASSHGSGYGDGRGGFPAAAVPGSAGGFQGSAAAPRSIEAFTNNPKGRVRDPIAETTSSKHESTEQARPSTTHAPTLYQARARFRACLVPHAHLLTHLGSLRTCARAHVLTTSLQARDRFQTIAANHYGPRSTIKNHNGGGNCPRPWDNYGSSAMVAVGGSSAMVAVGGAPKGKPTGGRLPGDRRV